MNLKKYCIYTLLALSTISCVAKQEIAYMKDIESLALENSIKNNRSNLQPGDQLMITVSAKDMDVVRPFNQTYSSTGTITQYSDANSNSRVQNLAVSGQMYVIDIDGNITFPQIGKVSTKNENIETFKLKLVDAIKQFVKEPSVDMKLVNFRVSVLGEVKNPGTFVVPDGNITLLQALGLAGDMTNYGLRNNVLVVRNIDGEITKSRIDMTSAQFINSPYYYMKQNDIIYVQPNNNREKAARVDPNTGLYISVASVIASLVLGVLALAK